MKTKAKKQKRHVAQMRATIRKEPCMVENQLQKNDLSVWGVDSIIPQNIIIPSILLMQGSSEFVKKGKHRVGDFVDSLTEKILGNTVEVIPFFFEESWWVYDLVNGKEKFNSIEPVTSENRNRAYEDLNKMQRYKYCLKFYCLRPEDVGRGGLPYTISFRSTSLRTGKKIYTQMYIKNQQAGLPPPAYVVKISHHEDKTDDGSFLVLDMEVGRKTTEKELVESLQWLNSIKAGKTRADDSMDIEVPL